MNIWGGKYFLIGKNLKITEKEPETKINLFSLIKKIKEDKVQEVTFALSLNPEGELTMDWIKEQLLPLVKTHDFKITELGRGISLGTEVEYTDKLTIEEALKHRTRIR
jgi:recombination protein RecR